MISSIVKPMFVWSTNTPMRPRSDIAPWDGVISGIVPWGYMRSNRVVRAGDRSELQNHGLSKSLYVLINLFME